MNDFASLSLDDQKKICELISGKTIKEYYLKNQSKYNKINPSFRAKTLLEKEAIAIAIKKADHPFINVT